jgi:hypothetical protein
MRKLLAVWRRGEDVSPVVIIPNRGRAETDALTRALINLAAAGLRMHCSDPTLSELWTSDHEGERAELRSCAEVARLCLGCPIITECDQAATANDERWGVWGGCDRSVRPGRKAA